MDGRRMYCPRGRVLGGSSSINGMAYVRGHARDYDRWAQAGLAGWGYADVLPYFKRAETREIGADDYRGGDGPLHVSTGACANPAVPGLHRCRGPGRLSVHRRHERLPPGRFRRDGHDHVRGPALERCQRLSAPGHAAEEPRGAHARAVAAHPFRWPARRRRRLCARQRCAPGDRRARGDRLRRRHQRAAAPDALGHRRCRRARPARHSGGRAPARRRQESAGPSRDLRPARLHPADLALQRAEALEQAAHRRRLDPLQARPGGDQPLRGGRLHPLARRRRASRPAVPLPADRDELRRHQPAGHARLPGPCRADAADLGGPHRADVERPAQAALDPVQLHGQPKAIARRCAPPSA